MDQDEIDEFNAMSEGEKWRHILIEYMDTMRPVPVHFVRWIMAVTAPTHQHR